MTETPLTPAEAIRLVMKIGEEADRLTQETREREAREAEAHWHDEEDA
jgi:hypothetical protein